ncbi:hypothetical protein NDU88_006901 [Pleurodeles waltl]|uniref:Uncharacterized protein n=1 Tax=Pleurodeles waltl TaxID=8319 RepID=A0AAV7NWG8_PLEWA|nr:hypothetical protein NDU88_006901 [Pleurodeles waltl]
MTPDGTGDGSERGRSNQKRVKDFDHCYIQPHYASGGDRRIPRGTSSSDPRSLTHANPEEEGCYGTPEEEKGDAKKVVQDTGEERRNKKD